MDFAKNNLSNIRSKLQTEIGLNSVNRKFYLVFFTTITAFLFLNFFEPFGLYYDDSLTHEEVFIELFIAIILAFIVLLFSQFVLRNIFKLKNFTVFSICLWFLLEAVLVASSWFFLDIVDKGINVNLPQLWFENFLAYVLIMFFPYFLFVSIIHFKDTLNSHKRDIISAGLNNPVQDIVFKDKSGIVKLVLKTENLLFIQSADNYVEINYLEKEIPAKLLLRNSIKKIEQQLINTSIIRCHRSYLVNTLKLEQVKKTASGFTLILKQIPDMTIPVSKSYISEFKKHTAL